MTEPTSIDLLALVIQTPSGAPDTLEARLCRLGSRTRIVSPRDLTGALPADLLAVHLPSVGPNQCPLLHRLPSEHLDIPLPLVTAPDELMRCRRELDELRVRWPRPFELLVEPYCQEELRTKARWLASGHARVRAAEAVVSCGPFRVDLGHRRAWYEGRPVELHTCELRLLSALVEAGGAPVSKAVLAERTQGVDDPTARRNVEVYACRLRDQLAEAGVERTAVRVARREGYYLHLD